METDPIKDFYDRYTGRQLSAGINERHHLIFSLARELGLASNMRVLEMGCGVGTLTSLLASHLSSGGSMVAVDISPASIEIARKQLGRHRHVEFKVVDVVNDQVQGPFDMIILPDVLEHIPMDLHPRLWANIKAALSSGGSVLVHGPDPYYTDWLQVHHPELLQVVDLALHLPGLLADISRAGLALHYFQRHRIWMDAPEYMAFLLVHEPVGHDYAQVPVDRGGISRTFNWIKRLIK